LEVIRHKSDYDDFYIASKSETEEQVMIARNVIELVEEYLKRN
jgi:HEPN domain-containing protein